MKEYISVFLTFKSLEYFNVFHVRLFIKKLLIQSNLCTTATLAWDMKKVAVYYFRISNAAPWVGIWKLRRFNTNTNSYYKLTGRQIYKIDIL